MRILSLNCNLPPWKLDSKNRIPKITNFLKKHNPEIICLQEVFSKKDAKLINKYLTNYKHYYHAKNLLIISKLELKNKIFFEFKEQGNLISLGLLDRLYRKAFQLTKIETKNYCLSLVNCHLLSAKGSKSNNHKKTRRKQIKEILNKIEKNKNSKIILTGDFNFDTHSEPYLFLLKKGYQDPLEKNLEKTHKDRKIDHFFIKNFKKNIKSQIILDKDQTSISDHKGILIEL